MWKWNERNVKEKEKLKQKQKFGNLKKHFSEIRGWKNKIEFKN